MKVAIFAEDAAHASFLTALLERLLTEEGAPPRISLRNAVGGHGAVLTSLRRYVRDLAKGREEFADLLVVAIDGNCQGSQTVRRSITEIVDAASFVGQLACAVPNPHIELWYLSDGRAVHQVVDVSGEQAALPAVKCEKGRYKSLLRAAFLDGDIDPPGGGSEYGTEIAKCLDLRRAMHADQDLARFVEEVRSAVRLISSSARSEPT